ncbi:MAG TPA: magnesium/cobalt transporter CorA [Chloroflexota bacterium]|nr:magnesium/cobalt transporter CorA [Chloroflexota bacterium]HUM68922.1 magnesium/cobalt transporter CorA [Chloroflexota bacterium]
MIRILYSPAENEYRTDLELADIAQVLTQPQGLLWLDFSQEPLEVGFTILRDIFQFHPLAVDDALTEAHVPKIDDWQEYLYVVLRAFAYIKGNEEGEEETLVPELDVFIGHHFIVTYHELPITAVDRVWATCQRDMRLLRNGPDHLLYRLTDEIINDAITVVEQIQETLDDIEDIIFATPSPQMAERIFYLKRNILRLRRVVAPQREVLNKLARDDYAVIDPRDRIYFRDGYDHLMRLYELIDNLRDMTGSVLDTYLSVVNNNMNSVMKTLAVFTALFLPLTFITGFFGMNFFATTIDTHIWSGWTSFALAMGIMLTVPIVMLIWIRHRGWL